MNRYQAQTLYGIFIALTGILLIVESYTPSRSIQYGVAAGMIISAFFAFAAANRNKENIAPFKYNRYQAIAMLLYAITVLIFAITFERFTIITFSFLLFFGITEILVGFELMSGRRNISLALIVFRMFLGLFTAIGALVILATAFVNPGVSLLTAGIVWLLIGLDFILFANHMRQRQRPGLLQL